MERPIVTENTPTGIVAFDLAAFPPDRYQALAGAIDALTKSGIKIGQADFLVAIGQIAAAMPFADNCESCNDITYPNAARLESPDPAEGAPWVEASYDCHRCGAHWTCGWSATAPTMLG